MKRNYRELFGYKSKVNGFQMEYGYITCNCYKGQHEYGKIKQSSGAICLDCNEPLMFYVFHCCGERECNYNGSCENCKFPCSKECKDHQILYK